MPKSVVSLIAACLLAFSSLRAQTSVFPSVSGGLSNATFLSPPSAPALNAAYLFTDASATGACSGGGSSYAICAWNGSSFGAIAGTSTGLGDPGSNGVVFRNGSGTSIPATATQMAGPHFCSDAGATDSYACNLSPAIAAYVTGTFYWFKANTANTGAASINFNAKGALTIKKMIGGITTDLSTGDIVVGQWVGGFYDGTNFQMATQLGTAVDTTSTQTLTNKTLDGVSPATMAFVDPTSSVQTQINGKVGTATTVNGHALSSNVTVTNADLGAVPTTTTVNGHALSSNVTVTNADLGSVPTTTTVNGHALSSNVTVTTADVSALGDPGSNGVVKRTAANVSAAATAGTDYSAPGTNETTTGNRTLTGLLDASGGTHTLPAKVGLAASKPATCTTGEIYFATDATAGQQIYECSSTNTWTQQLNSGGGSGSVVLTSGSGAPVASCTAPSSSNLAIYTDTTNNQAYYCSATNTWRRLLSVNPTDPMGIAGTTQSQAAAIAQNGGSVPASSILCYGDSTANTLICLDSSSNAFEMVKGIANPSDTQVVNYIDQSGIQHRIAPGLGDPAANGVVRRTALNTTAVTTIPSDATQFLNGAATPAFAAVKDSDLSTSNVATNNATTAKHGFVPILPNDATKYYDGTGAFSVPAGTGGGGGGTLLVPPNQLFTAQTSPQTFTHNLNTAIHQTLCSDGSGNEGLFGITLGANSDTITFTGTQTFTCVAIGGLASYTFATLPSSPPTNTPALVTDCSTASCTVGGGSIREFLIWTGAAWQTIGGTGGSGTVTSSGTPSPHQVAIFTSSTDVKGVGVGATDKPLVGVTSGDPAFSKLTLTNPATGSTFTLADGKTLTVNNTLTLSGTDSTTIATPTTSATMARTDAAQTFTGVQTFSTAIATGSGGTGTGSTLTGLVRGGNPFTAAEISGDCVTSGSNAIVCTKSNSVTLGFMATATGAVNPQTATYQVLAADFDNSKTITVASGTFTITLVASGSQPITGKRIDIINYGSGVVTIARSGQNINGGTSSLTLAAGSATAPTSARIISDGTNYFGNVTISSASGSISGLTTNTIPKAASSTTIANSSITDDGTTVSTTEALSAGSVLTGGVAAPAWFTGTGGLNGLGFGTCTGTNPAGTAWLCASSGSFQLFLALGSGNFLPLTQTPASTTNGNVPAFSGNNGGLLTDSGKVSANLVSTTDTGTVTNAMLAGSIANAKLANSATTVNGQTCTLGSTCTILPTIPNTSVVSSQSSNQAVTLATAPTAGYYVIDFYANKNGACTGSVSYSFSWTDSNGSETLATGNLSASPGYLSGSIPIRVASGNVSFTTTVTGACTYDGTVTMERKI